MKDVFYTILVVWIIWKVIGVFTFYSSAKAKFTAGRQRNPDQPEGKTSIKYSPTTEQKISDDEGEYVDFEEIK